MTLNAGLVKNATGPDLQQLFIGSEGIFGMVTEAWMRLTVQPKSLRVMVLGVAQMEHALSVLTRCRQALSLTAFEFFSAAAVDHVVSIPVNHHRFPTRLFMCWLSTSRTLVDPGTDMFESLYQAELVTDGVLAQSERDNQRLWRYREGISEAITPRTPYKHDLSVNIHQAPAF